MEYVRVEGGCIIDGPRVLPEIKEAFSASRTLSRIELAGLGWLPVVDIICSDKERNGPIKPFLAVRKTHVVRYCYPLREDVAAARISRHQLETALDLLRLRSKAEQVMLHVKTDGLIRSEWCDKQIFGRYSVTLLGLGAALGLTDNQLDRLFALATEC